MSLLWTSRKNPKNQHNNKTVSKRSWRWQYGYNFRLYSKLLVIFIGTDGTHRGQFLCGSTLTLHTIQTHTYTHRHAGTHIYTHIHLCVFTYFCFVGGESSPYLSLIVLPCEHFSKSVPWTRVFRKLKIAWPCPCGHLVSLKHGASLIVYGKITKFTTTLCQITLRH